MKGRQAVCWTARLLDLSGLCAARMMRVVTEALQKRPDAILWLGLQRYK